MRHLHQIFVIEVMGRHAGWIAAAGALVADQGIPVITLFPEVEFNQETFLAAVKAKVEQFGYCTICVSEGCHWPDGRFLAEQGTRDAFGHAQLGGAAPVVANLVKDALGVQVPLGGRRIICSAPPATWAPSPTWNRPMPWARAGVEYAIAGHSAIMPTVRRQSSSPYVWEIGMRPCSRPANVEKFMPKDFISGWLWYH